MRGSQHLGDLALMCVAKISRCWDVGTIGAGRWVGGPERGPCCCFQKFFKIFGCGGSALLRAGFL